MINGGLTGRLVKVAFEYMLIEDEQSFQNLESMLVCSSLANLQVQLLVCQWLLSLESLERKGWSEL